MNASEPQFSFTRAALSTGGRAASKFLALSLSLCWLSGVAAEAPKRPADYRPYRYEGSFDNTVGLHKDVYVNDRYGLGARNHHGDVFGSEFHYRRLQPQLPG